MDYDDIIYVALLVLCIVFGYIYRQIENIEQKKWVGSGLGLLIVLIVSGYHIWHPLFTFAVNALIILVLPKSYLHIVSFVFTFLYLMFFRTTIYFGIPYPPAHTNMVQMILTLKLVGLAYEVNSSYSLKKNVEKSLEDESNLINPNLIDIFHYAFNYIGVLTGPYYRYRTQLDFFNRPFSSYVNHKEETLKKMLFIPLYVVLFLSASYYWPISYALSDEFYNNRSWLYRFWFSWPNFFIFRMRLYIAMILSECICTMAGLGAYPCKSQAKPGHGPSTNFEEMKTISNNPELLKIEKYDFKTINNIDPYQTEFCTTFRDGIKHWNICVQYWFAFYVYKRFPNKQIRALATMMLSAYWHGMYTGHYICIGLAPFYFFVDDVYVKLFLKDGSGMSLKLWEWIIWLMKMQAFSYLSMAFTLLSLNNVIRFYSSTYYCGFIGFAIMYAVGVYMLKMKKIRSKESERRLKNDKGM
ncbi:hypothetical protein FQR65_LT10566 [Abscondita terminalis]|nr:hypothetical protein FQR65_LT10566 [Abscondita terminalis]